MPLSANSPFAMSQDVVNLVLPIGSNCTEQSDGAATTLTGVTRAASVNCGLTASVRASNPGTKETAARPNPSSITGLRPTKSETHAKSMCNGAAAAVTINIRALTVLAGTL